MQRTIDLHAQAYRRKDLARTQLDADRINDLLPQELRVAVHRVPRAHVAEASAIVTEPELRACLQAFQLAERPRDADPDRRWWAHLTLAQALRNRDAYGMTYNANASGPFVRRAFALFLIDIDDVDREEQLFYRTLVHELGHVLNLDHADADGETLMKGAPRLPLQPAQLRFSRRSRHHLVEHPVAHVAPGRAAFGDLCDDPDPSLDHPEREAAPAPDHPV
jgi:hypothetical protein